MKQIRGRPMAGRTVLITGGTAGIGKGTALGLATMGAHVAVTGRVGDRLDAVPAHDAAARAATLCSATLDRCSTRETLQPDSPSCR